MSDGTLQAGLGSQVKLISLTGHMRHPHKPSPVSKSFVAPPAKQSIAFNSIALAAAIARTATTRDDAPVALLAAYKEALL